MNEPLQTNAADPAQLENARRYERDRARRRVELFRRQLATYEGREFVWDVILPELGFMQHIGGPLEAVYGAAALHNLAGKLIAVDLSPHTDLYLQMQAEGMKRRDREAKSTREARKPRPREDAGAEAPTTD